MNRDKNLLSQAETEEKRTRAAKESFAPGKSARGERKSRVLFLIVDILLLAVIVSAILFLVTLLTPVELFDSSDELSRSLTYTVEFKGIDSDSLAFFKEGVEVVDVESGNVVGKVVSADSRPYEVYTNRPSKEPDDKMKAHVVIKNTYPDEFKTVSVVIATTAEYEPGVGYAAKGCRIAVGRTYQLRFPGFAGSGVCVSCKAE